MRRAKLRGEYYININDLLKEMDNNKVGLLKLSPEKIFSVIRKTIVDHNESKNSEDKIIDEATIEVENFLKGK